MKLKLFFCNEGSKYILQENGQRKQHTVVEFCFTSFCFKMRSKVINPLLFAVWCVMNWEQYGCWYTACLFSFFLALESELVACSAAIKRRWRYRAASQRLSALAVVTRLTPSLTSLHKAATNPDSYIETCGPLWLGVGKCSTRISTFNYLFCCVTVEWIFSSFGAWTVLNHPGEKAFQLKPFWKKKKKTEFNC